MRFFALIFLFSLIFTPATYAETISTDVKKSDSQVSDTTQPQKKETNMKKNGGNTNIEPEGEIRPAKSNSNGVSTIPNPCHSENPPDYCKE